VDGVTPLVKGDRELAAMIVSRRLEDAGLAEGALAAAREAMRVAPDSAAPFARAFELLRKERRWPEATTLAAAFTRRRPAMVEGWVRLGIAASRQGEHERAMRYFARALAIDRRALDAGMTVPVGYYEFRESEGRAGRQKPATVDELP
jgi:tetratricopeptide (TPR) repeat protein